MSFTTRPEIAGTFGVIATTHWIASAVGMSILERGGNAFDAAAAAGFTLNVVEPHLNGPGGDMTALFYSAGEDKIRALCAQGVAPAKATIEYYRDQGLDLVPGSGLLATVVPGAFDGWMLMLRDYGSMSLREVLEPALHYAEAGHPILPAAAAKIEEMSGFFLREWPTSAEVWLPGGNAPAPWSQFRNTDLAGTWSRIIREAESVQGRERQVDAAREVFYKGFVAETIDEFFSGAELMDATDVRRRGVLRAGDLAGWQATFEEALSCDYGGWTVHKTGPWGQGPVLLQSLALLKGTGISGAAPCGADFVHLVTEALKLSMADREAYYGDPDFSDIPVDTLLSGAYNDRRRTLIENTASFACRPGAISGYEAWADAARDRAERRYKTGSGVGAGEPTMAHLARQPGDTVHLDVIDRWGNMVSATPSGGWLQSSPVVPGSGMPMNTRAQMFWLDEGVPASLGPGRRPRTTLTPSLASYQDRPCLVFGTPGGDSQDQCQLIFFLRLAHHEMNLQQNIDMPIFCTEHVQGSFYPRRARPGRLVLESRFEDRVIDELRARGHAVDVSDPWSIGRLTACRRSDNGLLQAAATPRLMQAYAIGR